MRRGRVRVESYKKNLQKITPKIFFNQHLSLADHIYSSLVFERTIFFQLDSYTFLPSPLSWIDRSASIGVTKI